VYPEPLPSGHCRRERFRCGLERPRCPMCDHPLTFECFTRIRALPLERRGRLTIAPATRLVSYQQMMLELKGDPAATLLMGRHCSQVDSISPGPATSMAQPITRFETLSNSNFVLFRSFAVVVISVNCDQPSEQQTSEVTGCRGVMSKSSTARTGLRAHRFVRHGCYCVPTTGTGAVALHLPTKETNGTKSSEHETLDAISQFFRGGFEPRPSLHTSHTDS